MASWNAELIVVGTGAAQTPLPATDQGKGNMVRIPEWLIAVVVLGGVFAAGCQQHHFQTEADYRHYKSQALRGVVETESADNPDGTALKNELPPIRTVLNPDANMRRISLAECIAIALENGRTGEFFDRAGGRRSSLVGPSRGLTVSSATDSIRVFAYDPAIAAVDVEQSLTKFDTFWQTSATWSRTDRPVGTALDTFFGFGRNSIDQDVSQVQTALVKPLPTGGLANITFTTDYEFSNLNPRVNPAYRPTIQLGFEQPLLQGFGVGINQLTESHPGSTRLNFPVPTGGRVPGILLARIFADEAQIEFERRVQDLLFSVEEAYWSLYAAYWDLYSREIGVRQGHAAWMRNKARLDAGQIAVQELAQIEEQFYNFRAQRISALGTGTGRAGVLDAERRLRYLLGLPPEDGNRLIPMDAPTVAPFRPDFNSAYAQALARRPELIQTRQEIQASQLQVLRLQNTLLPDLRAFGNYEITGLGSRLDGPDEINAIKSLTSNQFQNWNLGLIMRVPLGYRDAHAQVTRAQLQLAQRVTFLRDQEEKMRFNLQRSYQELVQFHELIQIQRSRRLAAAVLLDSVFKRFQASLTDATIVNLLEAQRNFTDALRDEHFAIADYNVALVDFERQKGTIMEYDNVSIATGPLPTCAINRASEHFRERARSIKLADPDGRTCLDGASTSELVVPSIPSDKAASVPNLIEVTNQLPKAPELLPKIGPPLANKP